MLKNALVTFATIIVLVLIGSGSWPFPNFGTTDSGMPESIIIRTTIQELAGLIYIAEDGGFFSQNGLRVTIANSDTGLECVKGMASGEAEIAASAEYPVVGLILKQENISLIGSIDKYQGQYIVGRKDRGIGQAGDLVRKKIGVARGTSTEFYLSRFLYLNNISPQDTTFVNVKPSQFADSIENGSVDAIIVPQVYLTPVEKRLGGNAIIWQAQNNQNAFGVLTCRKEWIASHPETINKLLRSLVQAENYGLSHPLESKAILQKRLNYTDEYMADVWPQNYFSLTLDQSLIAAMEDEARWMIANNLTAEKIVPDFTDYTFTKALRK